jgi:acetate kinase
VAGASPAAVGHRVVHGGSRFREPALIDDEVVRTIEALSSLAPLHNAPALVAIEKARRAFPRLSHVAVFDTAFHSTLLEEAAVYAVPTQWRDEWGVRRYGFHGISVQWCAELLGDRFRRLVVCHLGGGASVSAVLDGRSVDTTMGFSPLEGVPMETRSGSVDPGALLYLLRQRLLTLEELDHALHHDSGLRALSGMSGGMQEIEAAAAHNASARLALDVYAHRVAAAVAAMAASLGGLDAVAFTGGVGEGSSGVRERVCARLAFLGVDLDTATSRVAAPDADVATPRSAVRVIVVRSREELVIAREVRACIGCSTT